VGQGQLDGIREKAYNTTINAFKAALLYKKTGRVDYFK
jgi:hypothetical protein